MNSDDPLITLVAARNPVPDPEALSAEQRADAEALRRRIASVGPATHHPRRPRHLLVAAAGIVPAVVVLVLVLGIRGTHRDVARLGGSHPGVSVPAPGAPQTILVIGSDHRAGESYKAANTDTMLLVRVDPSTSTINLLSVPRDLEVRGPEGTAKLNAVYSIGGPSLLLKTLQTQIFPGLQVNHIIDFNFAGFSDLIDAIGCVYTDVDHRYYNDTALTDYASIDIQPGYQRLCGEHQASTGALAFVRFRHTDSDLVREARQEDFIRWLKQGFSVSELIDHRDQLLRIFGEHAQTDGGLHSVDGVLNLFNLLAFSLGHPFQRVPFPARLRCGESASACSVTAPATAEAAAYRQFMGASTAPAPAAPSRPSGTGAPGLITDPVDGQAQAAGLAHAGLPIFYPARILSGSEYCAGATGNCNQTPNPASEYAGAYPRQYKIGTYPSYRMTLVINPQLGEYYGVQGTTWRDPPILNRPTQTETIDGRRLLEFYDGDRLSLVAFRTAAGSYWISNTLTDSIGNRQLIAIAASMQLAG